MIGDLRKMSTRRFAIDQKGNRIYIGSTVRYKNSTLLIEDIQYLTWNKIQYLTLSDKKNKNKKFDLVPSSDVMVSYRSKN